MTEMTENGWGKERKINIESATQILVAGGEAGGGGLKQNILENGQPLFKLYFIHATVAPDIYVIHVVYKSIHLINMYVRTLEVAVCRGILCNTCTSVFFLLGYLLVYYG
jgi:hypothetical protein